jgi:hypothetical protein
MYLKYTILLFIHTMKFKEQKTNFLFLSLQLWSSDIPQPILPNNDIKSPLKLEHPLGKIIYTHTIGQ